MYIDAVPNRNSRPAVLLREGWRAGGKICKRALANLTQWPAHQVELLRRLLRHEPLVASEGAFADTAHVVVKQTIAQIGLTPASAGFKTKGEARAFTATAFDPGGTPVRSAPTFTWTTSNALVATVAGDGTVTAVGNGVSNFEFRASDLFFSIYANSNCFSNPLGEIKCFFHQFPLFSTSKATPINSVK